MAPEDLSQPRQEEVSRGSACVSDQRSIPRIAAIPRLGAAGWLSKCDTLGRAGRTKLPPTGRVRDEDYERLQRLQVRLFERPPHQRASGVDDFPGGLQDRMGAARL